MISLTKRFTKLAIFGSLSFILTTAGLWLYWDAIQYMMTSGKIPTLDFQFEDFMNRHDDIVDDMMKKYDKIMKAEVKEPNVGNLVYAPESLVDYGRENATLLMLVRNKELRTALQAIETVESQFNHKFQYPYVFLNDKEFTDKFKSTITEKVSGQVFFETIDKVTWDRPDWIDSAKESERIKVMRKYNVGYADKLSYHNMCRYYSRGFYNHPRLQQFKYYWRFEPGTHYHTSIDYDVFKFMSANDKTYGFVISLYDTERSIETLWPETLKFIEQNPQFVNKNAAWDWLTEKKQNPQKTRIANGYSTCHFWSNFEIGDMDFFRSEAYTKWVNHLDATGGFYYERWGDAPVHSIGATLFQDKSKVHWFRDIGYYHAPYYQCPNSPQSDGKCEVGKFSFPNLSDQNCLINWIEMVADNELSMY